MHLSSPPRTPEHSGFFERQYRHIVDIGLSLLTQASLPLTFWSYAFLTPVFLINRLPTNTLTFDSAYFRLFHSLPNYSRLRIFGCLCYPCFHPYNGHKLQPRSIPCIFVGYSPSQSSYLCLNSSTNRLYSSRHVHFVETFFPSISKSSLSPLTSSTSSSDWVSVQISVLLPSATSPSSDISNSPSSPSPSAHLPLSSSSSSPSPPPCGIITRSKNQIFKPIQRLNLCASVHSQINVPSSISQALKHPLWFQAMASEIDALHRNQT